MSDKIRELLDHLVVVGVDCDAKEKILAEFERLERRIEEITSNDDGICGYRNAYREQKERIKALERENAERKYCKECGHCTKHWP